MESLTLWIQLDWKLTVGALSCKLLSSISGLTANKICERDFFPGLLPTDSGRWVWHCHGKVLQVTHKGQSMLFAFSSPVVM